METFYPDFGKGLVEEPTDPYAKPLPEQSIKAVGALNIDPFHDVKRWAEEHITARPVYDRLERVPVTV
jgi:hypothetical protein